MRRMIGCALALLVLLTGCSGEAAYTADDVQALLDAGLFEGDMEAVDSAVAPLVLGVDAGSVTDCVCYMATNTAASADEAAVLILTDEAAAQAAEDALRQHLASRLEDSQRYAPAAVPRLEAAVLRRSGNTVLLAVGDPDRLEAAVDGLHR